MRYILITLLVACSVSTTFAQPRWQWVKTGIGPAFDVGNAMDIGPDGDLFVVGTYYDSVSFDGKVLPSIGSYDIFSARYSPAGILRDWDSYGSLYLDESKSIAVDKNGNYYVCGIFNTEAQVGGAIITSIDDGYTDDIFLAKFDKYGVMGWVKVFGSVDYDDDVPYVAVDSLGNVYLAGGYGETGVFDSKNIASKGKLDIYISKISAAGDVIWVQSYGGSENDFARSVAVSPNGDRIYIAGSFISNVDFGFKEIVSFVNKEDVFVQCFNANGVVQWAERIGSNSPDRDVNISSDKTGELFITGAFFGLTTFFSQQIQANGEFFSDMYIARVGKDGAIGVLETYGGPYNDAGLAVTTDASGAFYVTGYYDSTSVFGGTTVNSAGGRDVFVARFFPNGSFEWIRTAGGVFDDEGRGIAVSPSGIPYVSGFIDTEAWFEGMKVEGDLTDPFVAALECGPDTRMVPDLDEITICEGSDTSIFIRAGYPLYVWNVGGGVVQSGIKNSYRLDTLKVGTYQVYAIVTDFYSCSLNSDTITVNVTVGLPKPVITKLGNDLSTNVTDVNYQWYLEGNPIPGATQSYVTIQGEGWYQVLISDSRGCTRWSDGFLVGSTSVTENGLPLTIYPNPFSSALTVIGWEGASITITDIFGRLVAQVQSATSVQQIAIEAAVGTYLVNVRRGHQSIVKFVAKQ